MPRTPKQIAVVPEGAMSKSVLIVLCDDGTMWLQSVGVKVWTRIQGPPTDEESSVKSIPPTGPGRFSL